MYGYNNPQVTLYDKQIIEEKNKLAELERQKIQAQYAQPTILNQTIQAGPQHSGIKYAESIDEVNREIVFFETLFVNKGFTNLWVKNPQGKVKTYLLEEVIPKDEKDLRIEMLENQIADLKKEINNNANVKSRDIATTQSSISSTISETRGNEEE